MSIEKEVTIKIISRDEDDWSRSSRCNTFSKTVSVSELRKHFKEFMGHLQSIIDEDIAANGPFYLSEVQFGAEITKKGEFKLMGTSSGVEAKSAVMFTLKRHSNEN